MISSELENYLKTADSRALDILFWLLHNRDSVGNVVTTLDSVASECDVTKVTVNRVFQRLYQKGLLIKIRNGHYKFTGLEELTDG